MVSLEGSPNGDRPDAVPGVDESEPTGQTSRADTPDDPIAARLRAVERALVDGNPPADGLATSAEVVESVDELADDLAAIEERLDELDAALQAVRGYIGQQRKGDGRTVRDGPRSQPDRRDSATDAEPRTRERSGQRGPPAQSRDPSPQRQNVTHRDSGRSPTEADAFADALNDGVLPRPDRPAGYERADRSIVDRLREWL